ncbi:hypothetical protein K353_05255 [Kitasatospora sp. SolWspMP-SS2h]|uniref:LppU/SCO3897 family protein n=1 Tax=Kitasatospora sp. SolWspMP-SS2h TaxID=1305729 RepID=UPI000DC02CB0|nr:toxin-antitoxin system, toxin component [Kitasatospora sp. SolWspMP-SS2h]RAJ34609.1 hypothetical protein K353_05255 [Kitasatospora sp. SolWspMP-SS2h]
MSVPITPPPADTAAPVAVPAAPPAGAEPAGWAAPAASGPQPGPFCRFCGSVPAANVTVRGHQGFLVMMRFLRVAGPFCRDCGTATLRRMTADSLWQGWWGVASAVINPVTMLMNLVVWLKLRKLPAPVPGAPGTPLPTGRPLYRRPQVLGLLIPVVAVGALLYSIQQDPDYADVGDCVHNSGSNLSPDVSVVDCGGSDADFRVVGRLSSSDADACTAFPEAEAGYWVDKGSSSYTLCLARVTP